jgi:hypothetical protein
LPYRITRAEGKQLSEPVEVVDADGFVVRADRVTFRQLPGPGRPGLRGLSRVMEMRLEDIAAVEWVEGKRPDPPKG